jgi:drug/metabolite transporter (DMT)-like permease
LIIFTAKVSVILCREACYFQTLQSNFISAIVLEHYSAMRFIMSPLRRLLFLITLTCMWSPSFLFIKLAIQELPPLTVVSLRVSLAACVLAGIVLWKKSAIPKTWRFWTRATIMALLSSVIPFSLFCYAEQSIDSALAAVLNGTTPMFTAVLAQLFVASDRMNRQKVLGVSLSCFGLILLFAPKLQEGVSGTTLGMSAALIASLSYSLSHIYGKLYLTGLKPFIGPFTQMFSASIVLWPFALYHDQSWTLPIPSVAAWMGICGLALCGTVCAFLIYYHLLEHCGPTAISTVACFFPVVGMLLGFIFLGETFTITNLIAAGTILMGMLFVNEIINVSALKEKENPQISNE